jgi:hypothetical protein
VLVVVFIALFIAAKLSRCAAGLSFALISFSIFKDNHFDFSTNIYSDRSQTSAPQTSSNKNDFQPYKNKSPGYTDYKSASHTGYTYTPGYDSTYTPSYDSTYTPSYDRTYNPKRGK